MCYDLTIYHYFKANTFFFSWDKSLEFPTKSSDFFFKSDIKFVYFFHLSFDFRDKNN